MKTGFFLLFISLLFVVNAYAQKAWSLQECVDYALQNNIQVKQTELQTALSELNKSDRKLNMFPTLNGDASQNFSYGRSVDPYTNLYIQQNTQSTNFSLSSGVILFNGLQLLNSLKQSNLDCMASRYDLNKIKNDISLNVCAGYLQVLFSNELLMQAQTRLNAIKKQRDVTKALVDAGNLAQGNLYEIDAQVANEELQLVNAENALKQAYLDLTQLLNLTTTEGFTVTDPKVEVPSTESIGLSSEAIYATSLSVMPEIKSAEFKLQSAEKGLAIAKGAYYPRLSAYGSIGTTYSDRIKDFDATTQTLTEVSFGKQMDRNFNQSFGFGLSVPIFNGNQARNNVSRAKIQMQSQSFALDQQKQLLYKSIQQAHTDASAAKSRYDASQKSLEALQTADDYTKKKFNAGLLTSLDYITSQKNLTKAQSDLLQSKYDFIFRLKILDFYMGKPLGF